MTNRILQTTFRLSKMDCSSEEKLVRMALSSTEGIRSLSFDLPARKLQVVHSGPPDAVLERLKPLNLGADLQGSAPADVASEGALRHTTFAVSKMDCSSEESLVRMALAGVPGLGALKFDLKAREFTAVHEGEAEGLLRKLEPLNLGAKVKETRTVPSTGARRQSTFSVSKMDCSSEENLVRMALASEPGIGAFKFDLGKREFTVVHERDAESLLRKLQPLNLGATLKDTGPAPAAGVQRRSTFSMPKMDCSSEENLVRMALANEPGLGPLAFDLQKREFTAVHHGDVESLLGRLEPLNLGAKLLNSVEEDAVPFLEEGADSKSEARTLKVLLAINGFMFLVEVVLGIVAQSTGLIADSLDMFADAAVYGLALFAVGRAASMKVRAAHLAGWLQMVLAVGALSEVIRRAVFGSDPESTLMMGVGLVALIANVSCLLLITKQKDAGAHMKASYIFSANDVIANLGVIVAGVLVAWTSSPYPDLVIGTVIAFVVLNGARRILALR
jgi:copper chaperone CopZ